jgi:hypothetical protein
VISPRAQWAYNTKAGTSSQYISPPAASPCWGAFRCEMNEKQEARFWPKVDAEGDCWVWIGGRYPLGYGCFYLAGSRDGRGAHRVLWEHLVGPIPSGLELDHLCRNPPCVNPDHLEPVTHKENLRRGAPRHRRRYSCKRGHLLTAENVRLRFRPDRGGKWERRCLACRRGEKRRRRYWQNRA